MIDDIELKLITAIRRIKYTHEALARAITAIEPEKIIRGLDREALLSLLI